MVSGCAGLYLRQAGFSKQRLYGIRRHSDADRAPGKPATHRRRAAEHRGACLRAAGGVTGVSALAGDRADMRTSLMRRWW